MLKNGGWLVGPLLRVWIWLKIRFLTVKIRPTPKINGQHKYFVPSLANKWGEKFLKLRREIFTKVEKN